MLLQAIGPYVRNELPTSRWTLTWNWKSQAMIANGFVFVSGQMPATLEDNKIRLVDGTVTEKTHALCRNAAIVLEAARSNLDKVVKVTVSACPFQGTPKPKRLPWVSAKSNSVNCRFSSQIWMTSLRWMRSTRNISHTAQLEVLLKPNGCQLGFPWRWSWLR